MEIKFYNSYTNEVEPFHTLKENEVSMYVCGPTVYDYVHVGNLRPVVVFDVVRRFLEYVGYKVSYASNYTDVDDKIIKKAAELGMNEKDLAELNIKRFEEDLANINSRIPNFTPRVTEYMDKIIAFIDTLVKKGAAYEVDGDVYFRVASDPKYGVLSNTKIDDLMVGARIDENSKKESPLDFALWKKTETGIKWDSPWGQGRPGWHTECVVMINSIFENGLIDIHGGGFDLKFPHHENEIAQAEAYGNNHIAHTWMHNGFININNQKMSKSLGNDLKAHKAIEQYGAMPVRLLLVSTHYRAPVNFADDILAGNLKEVTKMQQAFKQLAIKLQLNGVELNKEDKASNIEGFLESLADDLNTSNALAYLYGVVKEANQLLRTPNTSNEALYEKYLELKDMFWILGLKIDAVILNDEDKKLYNDYNEARVNKDFARADEVRAELIKRNIL